MDRTLAPNHRWQSRLRHLSRVSCAVPSNSNRPIQACGCFHLLGRQNVLCLGSRVSLAAISIFAEMAGMELRSRPRLRSDLGDRLQIYRPQSQSRIDVHPITLGKRRAAADILLGAPLVSPRAWPHLSDRVRVSLGASGWARW